MDAAALEMLRVYRQRAATWQAAYERAADENQRLREELERLRIGAPGNRSGTGQCAYARP